ncbi:MAG TPA: hypothetical protein VGM51_19450 [Armatimonadota bacterium]|jgi:hypothetical protein
MKWMDRRSDPSDDGVMDDNTEMAFREGLRAQPVPPVSADFDARVLSAVSGRSPLWELLLSALRPALATAAVSTVVTTLILSSNVKTANPALAASPPASAQTLRRDSTPVETALTADAYLSMGKWRPAEPTHRPHHAGG